MCRTSDVPRPLVPFARLACAECSLLRAVLRESQEEPFKGPVSNLIADFSGSFLLQDCVTVHPKDVVHAADAKALTEESKFCLQVLTQLDTLG